MLRTGYLVALAMLIFVPLGINVPASAIPEDPPAPTAGDPYVVPSGGPQLVLFLQKLMQERPQNAEQRAKIREAALKAAEKLLSSKPTNEQLLLAVRAKSALLQDPEELAAFEADLKKSGKKLPARIVHVRLLTVALDRSLPDAAAFGKKLEDIKQFLGAGTLQAGDEQLALHAAETAERTGNPKLAGGTYEAMAKLLPAQPPFGAVAKRMQASARRWNLPGNAMRLEGKTLDGKAFSMANYRDKVVLVDFWATWCHFCTEEIPNIKKHYENYHDKGFEVVGVSVDTCPREKVVEFVQQHEIPWAISREADSSAKIAEYYGIHAFPTMLLIGRDGKVVSLNARGAGLGSLIEKALAAPAVGSLAKAPDDTPHLDDKPQKSQDTPNAEDAAARKGGDLPKIVAAASRTWTDSTGKHKVAAKFRGVINKNVKLECDDGRVINLPLEKLSDDDQAYIKKRKYGTTP
jgi:peroxiredoxin